MKPRLPIPLLIRSPTRRPFPIHHTVRPPIVRTYAERPRYTRFGDSPFGGSTSGGRPGYIEFGGYRLQWDRNTKIIAGVTGAGVTYYVWHLERVPETGRWRFIDVSEKMEREAGESEYKQTLQEYHNAVLHPNHPVSIFVRRVAERILNSTGLGHISGADTGSSLSEGNIGWDPYVDKQSREKASQEWEVFVIHDDKTKNAFVLPGGKIFVFTGILPITRDEDGLAAVLGHEIAHNVARHGAEKMSGTKVLLALAFILEAIGWDFGLSRLGLTLLLTLPNSRKLETEADQIGLRLMSQACYDPREAANMWIRMSQSKANNRGILGTGIGGSEVDFISTHPANAKRIKKIEQWLPEALAIRAASPECSLGGGGPDTFDSFKDAVGLPSRSIGW